ncbi:MAG: hypothetical protein U0L61_04025 [Alistipes sp.]|nr:hypothetical protein [Alistipes sp.]
MRIKHLLYLLLALPLAFAACNETEDLTPAPEKEAQLTLTSAAEMNFDAAGGEGVITYTAELVDVTRQADGDVPKVSVACEANWVELGNPDFESVSFTVAANEAEARETKIVVNYAVKSIEVVVKQAAKQETGKEYVMDAELASATRIASDELDLPNDHFAIVFVDNDENLSVGVVLKGSEGDTLLQAGDYTSEAENLIGGSIFVYETEDEYEFTQGSVKVELEGTTYTFDIELVYEDGGLYHFTYEGEVADMELPQTPEVEAFEPVRVDAFRDASWATGNFEIGLWINSTLYHSLDMLDTINPNNKHLSAGHYSKAEGTITKWSNFIANVNTGEGAYVAAAEIDLTHFEDGTTNIKGYIESEYGQRIELDWTGVVEGFDFSTEEPTPEPSDVVFNATYFNGSYYNTGIHNYYIILSDVEVTGSKAVEGATYYYFDIYSSEINNDMTIPNGVYTFDASNSYSAGTFTEEYGYGFNIVDDEPIWYLYAEGSKLTVSDNKMVAELIMLDGTKHVVTYEGNISLGNTDYVEPTIGLSSDMEIDVTGWTVMPEYFDQYYSNDTDNWYVHLYEDIETGNGGYIVLDLLADYATSVDYRGTFTCSEDPAINTFLSGRIEDDYLTGSWYTELTDGDISGLMVPFTDGTITVTFNDDGTQTFKFDCTEINGYKFTGNVTCEVYAGGYSAMSKVATGNHKSLTIDFGKKVVR